MATTIKVSEPTRDRINALGATTAQTAEQVVSKALDEYERALFWQEYRQAAEADRDRDYAAERELWDATLGDGERE